MVGDPKELINKLKLSHHDILLSLNNAQGSLQSYQELRPLLRDIENLIFYHFKLQSSEVSDKIRLFLEFNDKSAKFVDFLDYDLKEIKIKAITFFEMYPLDMSSVNQRNFISDFIALSKSLKDRIKIETDYLIPFLEAMHNNLKDTTN